MSSKVRLDEKAIAALERQIPELAQVALRRAYLQALTTRGWVVDAVDGKVVVTSRNGSRSVLHALEQQPIRVKIGERRVRKA